MIKIICTPILLAISLIYSLSVQADNAVSSQTLNLVEYDKTNDNLNINVTDFSLKLLLTKIALQTKLEIQFDDAAEDSISISIQSPNLDHAIKNILNGRNYSLQYEKDNQQRTFLTLVTILPKGKFTTRNTRSLLSLDSEALYQSMSNITLQQHSQIDIAKDRWQTRLDRLSPERRYAMEQRLAQRIIHRDKKRKQHNQRAEKNQLRKTEQEAYLQSMQTKSLLGLSSLQQKELKAQENLAHEKIKTQLITQLKKRSPSY